MGALVDPDWGPWGKIWIPVVWLGVRAAGDVAWRTPWLEATSPTVPLMAVTTPSNGAVTTDWRTLPLSVAMVASSCWMAAWVEAICSAVRRSAAGGQRRLCGGHGGARLVDPGLGGRELGLLVGLGLCERVLVGCQVALVHLDLALVGAARRRGCRRGALGDVVLVRLLVGRQQGLVGADLGLGGGHVGVGGGRDPVQLLLGRGQLGLGGRHLVLQLLDLGGLTAGLLLGQRRLVGGQLGLVGRQTRVEGGRVLGGQHLPGVHHLADVHRDGADGPRRRHVELRILARAGRRRRPTAGSRAAGR